METRVFLHANSVELYQLKIKDIEIEPYLL